MCITVCNGCTKLPVQVSANFCTVAVLSNKFVSDLHQTMHLHLSDQKAILSLQGLTVKLGKIPNFSNRTEGWQEPNYLFLSP